MISVLLISVAVFTVLFPKELEASWHLPLRSQDDSQLEYGNRIRRVENSCPTINFVCTNMPSVCDNMRDAIAQGKPTRLTRTTDEARITQNRKDCGCKAMKAKLPDSCDEYPFASTLEGGFGAVIKKVPLVENQSQGGQLRVFYGNFKIEDGGCFNVFVPPLN